MLIDTKEEEDSIACKKVLEETDMQKSADQVVKIELGPRGEEKGKRGCK